jgi:hypothetical protein
MLISTIKRAYPETGVYENLSCHLMLPIDVFVKI